VYAIIKSGGHQLKVTPGSTVTVDHVQAEAGEEVSLSDILLVATDAGDITAGAPFVAGAKVLAVVQGEAKGPKIRVFKKKRRKGMRRTKGHRSIYTRVLIKDIVV
jgi:large subunit ribosomal protein L21